MAKTRNTRRNQLDNSKADSLANQLSGLNLLGEIVTFGSLVADEDKRTHLHNDVVKALTDAGLDASVAKEFAPRHAFSRACRKLSENKIIDVVAEDSATVYFQFSGKHHKEGDEGAEIEYRKEHLIKLDKEYGIISCKDAEMKARAQQALDEAMERRTTSDVTSMVRKLFDAHADLMRIPGAIGVYFVPKEHGEFTNKIKDFLNRLGRRPFTFPVPAGTNVGDASIQQTVEGYFQGLLSELHETVDKFTLSTRQTTVAENADRFKQIRVKLEAYAHYLGDRREYLLEMVEKETDFLKQQIDKIAEDRKNAPPDAEGLDAFGSRLGSNAAKVNAVLNGEYKSMKQIMEEAGIKDTMYNHLNKLVERGLVQKLSSQYRLAPTKENE
jgi:hypothetical protein